MAYRGRARGMPRHAPLASRSPPGAQGAGIHCHVARIATAPLCVANMPAEASDIAMKLLAKSPGWPVLGPPQGIWEDIWPLGESRVHEPVYKRKTNASSLSVGLRLARAVLLWRTVHQT